MSDTITTVNTRRIGKVHRNYIRRELAESKHTRLWFFSLPLRDWHPAHPGTLAHAIGHGLAVCFSDDKPCQRMGEAETWKRINAGVLNA